MIANRPHDPQPPSWPARRDAAVSRRAALGMALTMAVAACSSPGEPVARATYHPPFGGVTVPLPGARTGQTLDTWKRDVAAVADSGLRLIRAPLSSWVGSSPSGAKGLDFSTQLAKDNLRALDHAKEKGLSVLVATAGHAGGPYSGTAVAYIDVARQYLGALASRLGARVDAWQVFNEPDRGHFRTYAPVSPDPGYWLELRRTLDAGKEAISEALPGVPLTTNLGGWPCNDEVESSWVQALDVISPALDVIGLDCYCGTDLALIDALAGRVQRIGARYTKPVWIVETGAPVDPENRITAQTQGRYGAAHVQSLRRGGAVMVGWYDLRDPVSGAERGYGLLDSSWKPKPGFDTLVKELS